MCPFSDPEHCCWYSNSPLPAQITGGKHSKGHTDGKSSNVSTTGPNFGLSTKQSQSNNYLTIHGNVYVYTTPQHHSFSNQTIWCVKRWFLGAKFETVKLHLCMTRNNSPLLTPKPLTEVYDWFYLIKPLQITAKHCAAIRKGRVLTHYLASETATT